MSLSSHSDHAFLSNVCPAQARAMRAQSSARTGSLQLKLDDVELALPLGPEVEGDAPVPYDCNTAFLNPMSDAAWTATSARVRTSSDVDGCSGPRFANAEVGLSGVNIEVTRGLRLRASEIAVSTLVARGTGSLSATVDVMLREAVLEIEGIDPIALDEHYAPNTVVRPEKLRPLGLHVVANAQVPHGVGLLERAIRVTALRLRFDGALLGNTTLYGEIRFAIADACLALALPASRREVPRLPLVPTLHAGKSLGAGVPTLGRLAALAS